MDPYTSLAHAILFGTLEEVEYLIQTGSDVNAFDEYGFTPLIEAAIANKTDMGELLLRYGADVNQTDITGRYPLHWTVDNYNLPFTKILLKSGANPNAYSRAAQPILVLPLLRRQKDFKQLLYHYGADLTFAKDYINTKLLGHRFELERQTHIVDNQENFILLDYEGFMFEFTSDIIQHSLERYKNHYEAKKLQIYFKKIDDIIKTLAYAAELIKYQQYTLDVRQQQQRIIDLLNHEPLLIPVAYEGHAITCVKYKDFLAKCDRGAFSKVLGSSVVIYKITKPEVFSLPLAMELIYTRQTENSVHFALNERLGLKPIDELPLPPQIVGNCSWANVEAAIPTLFYLLTSKERPFHLPEKNVKKESLNFFYAWREWDKDRALEECIQSFDRADAARKASKASILAGILVYRLSYLVPKDVERAGRIFSILQTPGYQYILDSFLRIYGDDPQDPIGKNLRHLMDMIASSLR
jgi:hypothetical protein